MTNVYGSSGMISWKNQQMPIDHWGIERSGLGMLTVKVYMDRKKVLDFYAVQSFWGIVGQPWLVRLDDEDCMFHGSLICNATYDGRDDFKHHGPKAECFADSLVLCFTQPYADLRKIRISEAKAMARNGNELFFDLLPLAELDKLGPRATKNS